MDKRNEKCTGNFGTREELEEVVRDLNSQGLPHAAVSKRTGVSFATVRRIIRGEDTPEIKYALERDWAADAPLRNKLNKLWNTRSLK